MRRIIFVALLGLLLALPALASEKSPPATVPGVGIVKLGALDDGTFKVFINTPERFSPRAEAVVALEKFYPGILVQAAEKLAAKMHEETGEPLRLEEFNGKLLWELDHLLPLAALQVEIKELQKTLPDVSRAELPDLIEIPEAPNWYESNSLLGDDEPYWQNVECGACASWEKPDVIFCREEGAGCNKGCDGQAGHGCTDIETPAKALSLFFSRG